MHTPSLRELQELLWSCLSQAPGTVQATDALLAVTRPGPTLDRAACLSVYADAYLWRLRDVLAENFPRVAAILGLDRFAALARDYLRDHPSEHPSVRHVGHALAAVVARRMDLPPYLADLARLEWARLEAFDAPDSPVLTAESLRSVPAAHWPRLRFRAIPALGIVHAEWPVHRLWSEGAAPDLEPSPTVIRVWRVGDGRVFHAPMEVDEVRALRAMIAGDAFQAICEIFQASPPEEAGRHAIALLARWLEDGTVAAMVETDQEADPRLRLGSNREFSDTAGRMNLATARA